MKTNCTWSLALVCAVAVGCPQEGLTASKELTVPNFDHDGPACIVRVPDTRAQCTNEGCKLPLPKGSTMDSLQLSFSCGPLTAPTGFENPPPEVKLQSIHAQNAAGHLSLIDNDQGEAAERIRELSFCLYGKVNIFCGFAKVLRLKDGPKGDGTGIVKEFVRSIELVNGSSK